MQRRHFLHAAGLAACTTMAGCSALDRTTELHSPERTDESDGAYWTFREGGDRLLNAGITFGSPFENGFVPLTFHTWHRERTDLESFRIEFRYGRPAGETPPTIYLDTFDTSPDPTIDFHDDADAGTTVLDVPDLGPVGVGSIGLSFIVRPRGGWLPDDLGIRIREVLSVEDSFTTRYATLVDDRIPFGNRRE